MKYPLFNLVFYLVSFSISFIIFINNFYTTVSEGAQLQADYSLSPRSKKQSASCTPSWRDVQCAGYFGWGWDFLNSDAKWFIALLQHTTSKQEQPVVVPGFRCSNNAARREFGTQQVREVRRLSTATSTYKSKDGHIGEPVTFLFQDRSVVVASVNGGCFFRLNFERNREKTETTSLILTTLNFLRSSQTSSLFGFQRLDRE